MRACHLYLRLCLYLRFSRIRCAILGQRHPFSTLLFAMTRPPQQVGSSGYSSLLGRARRRARRAAAGARCGSLALFGSNMLCPAPPTRYRYLSGQHAILQLPKHIHSLLSFSYFTVGAGLLALAPAFLGTGKERYVPSIKCICYSLPLVLNLSTNTTLSW